MKTKYQYYKSILVTLLIMVTFKPSTVWAEPILSDDDYYELATPEDLYWFAGQVNEGKTYINGRLTDNITVNDNVLKADGSLNEGTFKEWTPIGTDENPYGGIFDGQGKNISGLYFIGGSKVGLFSVTRGATLSNLNIKDSYFQAGKYVGALAGDVYKTTISLCSNASTIVVTSDYVGGLCGSATGSNFQNCYNRGLVIDKQCEGDGGCYAYYGGIAGYCESGTKITNCLNINYTGDGEYAGPFTYLGGDYSITNSYYLTSAPSGNSGKTSSQFASGQVCYLLNGMSQEGVWRQSVGEAYPSFVGDYTTYMPCIEHNYIDGVCSVCGMMYEPAFEDDYYLLSTVTDLKWFASEVNKGNKYINARLTNDIIFNENVLKADGSLNEGTFKEWTPIGNFDNPFYGNFEGGAHTISGLFVNNTVGETLAGFFGVISGDASVNMLNVKDSYFSGGACGTIAAIADGGGSISYCSNIGCTSIPNGDETYNGGIVGGGYYTTLTSCFSTGNAGNLYGIDYNISVNNSYYLSGQTNADGGMTEEYFKNGYVCYLLNNKETNSDDNYIVWRQNVGTDNYPVFDGPIVSGEGLVCPHIFNEDFVCGICGEEKTLTVDEDGFCRIRTAEELNLFARMVNRGNSTAKAMLMNDIVVNENVLDADGNPNSGAFKTWTPIGNGSYTSYKSFSGTFDGQGYTISGLYCGDGYQGIGLFGFTGDAVIKNVKIADSYFKGDSYVGGIVGCNRSGSDTTVVTGCTFNGTLSSKDNIGGICGYVYSYCEMKITDCNVYGHINASGTNSGGVCGYVGATTDISNCNVNGYMSSVGNNVGGICGNVGSTVTVKGCSMTGDVYSSNSYVGGICGHISGSTATITDCSVPGTVRSSQYVGGIVGYVETGYTYITDCVFDGSVSATSSSYSYAGGICGRVSYSTTITGCTMSGVVNSSKNHVGGICGYVSSAITIKDCTTSGTLNSSSSSYVGGIVGYKNSTGKFLIENCQNKMRVSANSYAGGIVGYAYNNSNTSYFKIEGCNNSGMVTTTNNYVGGIIGHNGNNYCEITDCSNTAKVEATSGYYAGGIVGYNQLRKLIVTRCSNTGYIKAMRYTAGICYTNYTTNINYCYNRGTVESTFAGYSAGIAYQSSTSYYTYINNCYSVGTVRSSNANYAYKIGGTSYTSKSSCYYLNSVKTTDGGRTAEQFADGSVCYELNGNSDYNNTYRQGFDDKYPSFEGPTVTYNRLHCTNHQYDEFGRCTICGAPKELEVVDGYCMISNKADLYAFALKVNKGTDNLKAKLANDIVINENVVDENGNLLVGAFTAWKPVGTYAKPFKGEFDGQGHTISGLYFNNVNESYVGLFGYCVNATVKNVLVKDSYLKAQTYVGAVVGNSEASVISKSANVNSTIFATGNYASGVVGYGEKKTMIDNCYNTGSVTGTFVGGIVYGDYSINVVANCLNSGTLSGASYSQPIAHGADVKKCYYLSDKDDFSGGKTEKQFRSGMVCWLLNNKESNENVIWRQKEGELYPSFEGDIVDYKPCTEHHFDENDVCTVCDALWTPEQDGDFYLIGNVKELYWFNEVANKYDQSISARVIDDIVVNENLVEGMLNGETDFRYWKPIAGAGYFYRGTFDGGDHTISGIYVDSRERAYDLGFFGYCGGCTIKNVKLEDAFVVGTSDVGGISGELQEDGTIENCTFNGFFSTSSSDCGGIVGQVKKGTIRGCVNNATLNVGGYSAGIVGYVSEAVISDCINNGNIRANGYGCGGIVGNASNPIISNCKNTGDLISTDNALGGIGGNIFGYFDGDIAIIDNCVNEGKITSVGYSAGICGNFYGRYITNCTNTGDVNCTGFYVGGICGNFGEGYVSDCSNSGNIVSTYVMSSELATQCYIGGVVGNYATNTNATNCHNTGYVEGHASYTGGLFGLYNGKQLTHSSNKGVVKGENWTGGIAGNSYQAILEDCFNEGDVTSTDDYVGGLSGVSGGQIEKCYSVANVTSTGNYVGGLVGQYSDTQNSIKDSYCRGDVSASNKDAYVGGLIGLKYGDTPGTVLDCYYVGKVTETSNSSILAGNCNTRKAYYLAETSNPEGGRSATLFANGTLTAMLNDGRDAESQVWFQNGDFPEFTGEAVEVGEHLFDNGFCLLHNGEFEQPKQNVEDGYYEIVNAGQLYWFANQVNTVDSTANARVVEDIFVNGNVLSNLKAAGFRAWTPIGNYYNKYAGNFNGGKHTISGLYANGTSPYQGLFGYSNGATISDIKVVDSYFNSTQSSVGAICGEALNTVFVGVADSSIVEGCAYIGGICGEAKNSSFTDCVNKSPIKATCTSAGGICGQSENTSYTKCKNYGDVAGCGAGAAGICASATGTELISDCENHGNISNTESGSGAAGICFYGCKAAENCINTGDVVSVSSAGAAGICGQTCLVFRNCRNEGNVKGNGAGVAGICLSNANILEDCVNTGNISATNGGNAVAGICVTAAENATITNCRNEGNVDGRYSGGALSAAGICYDAKGATISNCSNSGMVYGQSYGAAGITLYSRVASITDCENSGNISGSQSNYGVSGICGNGAEVVANCTNKGTIKAEGPLPAVAGICYQTSGLDKFTNCHNEGVIDGRWQNGAVSAAGICANGNTVEFDNCSNSADVYGAQSGAAGIALQAMTVKNSSNTGNIKAEGIGAYAVGIVGNAGIVTNCHNDGVIDGRWANGILSATGICYSVGQVMDCSNTGNVYGSQGIAAGVCGSGSYVSNCSNSGDVYGYNTATTAGICSSSSSYVGKCYNAGNITTDSSAVGGIVGCGDNNCYVTDCYNLGKVKCKTSNYKGQIYGGGICGVLTDSIFDSELKAKRACKQTISNCYSYDADCLNKICPDSATVSLINCYYLSTEETTDGGRTAEQFADGTVTSLLNGERSESEYVWFQSILYPTFTGDDIIPGQLNLYDDIVAYWHDGEEFETAHYIRENVRTEWNTLCLPFAFRKADCLTKAQFYTVDGINNGEVVLTQVTEVEAGQPVIFFLETLGNFEIEVARPISVVEDPMQSDLIGTFAMQKVDEGNYYYVKNNEFKQANGYFRVKPFHAYLQGSVNGAESYRIAEPDEMNEDNVVNPTITGIYNALGQRVDKMTERGVYVIVFSNGSTQKVRVSK